MSALAAVLAQSVMPVPSVVSEDIAVAMAVTKTVLVKSKRLVETKMMTEAQMNPAMITSTEVKSSVMATEPLAYMD